MTKFAEMAPQKLRTEAATTTAVVDWTALTIDPIDSERMNWARKTMLKSQSKNYYDKWPASNAENSTEKLFWQMTSNAENSK